jgi:hypothetical protein
MIRAEFGCQKVSLAEKYFTIEILKCVLMPKIALNIE